MISSRKMTAGLRPGPQTEEVSEQPSSHYNWSGHWDFSLVIIQGQQQTNYRDPGKHWDDLRHGHLRSLHTSETPQFILAPAFASPLLPSLARAHNCLFFIVFLKNIIL